MNQQITRPAVRYHGGKFRLAKWILDHAGLIRTVSDTVLPGNISSMVGI